MLLTIQKYLIKNQRSQTYLIIIGLCLCIILPSTYTVQKYTGVIGLSTFIVVGTATVITDYIYLLPAALKRLNTISTLLLTTALFVTLVIGFFAL